MPPVALGGNSTNLQTQKAWKRNMAFYRKNTGGNSFPKPVSSQTPRIQSTALALPGRQSCSSSSRAPLAGLRGVCLEGDSCRDSAVRWTSGRGPMDLRGGPMVPDPRGELGALISRVLFCVRKSSGGKRRSLGVRRRVRQRCSVLRRRAFGATSKGPSNVRVVRSWLRRRTLCEVRGRGFLLRRSSFARAVDFLDSLCYCSSTVLLLPEGSLAPFQPPSQKVSRPSPKVGVSLRNGLRFRLPSGSS